MDPELVDYPLEQVVAARNRALEAQDSDAVQRFNAHIAAHSDEEQKHAEKIALTLAHQQDEAKGRGFLGNVAAGAERGLAEVPLQAGNMVGAYPDSKVKDFETVTQPVMDSGWSGGGKLGNLLGEIGGTAPAAALAGEALGPAAAVLTKGKDASRAARVLKAALTAGVPSAGTGALLAGPEHRVSGAVGGGIGGTALGYMLPAALNAAGLAPKEAPREAAAQALMDEAQSHGIEMPLTAGQQAPHAPLASLERAGSSVKGNVGAEVAAARRAPEQAWQDVQFQRALPQGTQLPPGLGSNSDKLAFLNDALGSRYQTVAPLPIEQPEVALSGLQAKMMQSLKDPEILATPAQREMAKDFLEQQLSKIATKSDKSIQPAESTAQEFYQAALRGDVPQAALKVTRTLFPDFNPDAVAGVPQGGLVPKPNLTAGDLMEVRSAIRNKIRPLDKADPSNPVLHLLQSGEENMTDALHSFVPKDAADTLIDTDRRYVQMKALERAVGQQGVNDTGFTPTGYGRAIRSGENLGRFARGELGVNQPGLDSAKNAFKVFQEAPRTGERAVTLGTRLPVVGQMLRNRELRQMVQNPEKYITAPGAAGPRVGSVLQRSLNPVNSALAGHAQEQ